MSAYAIGDVVLLRDEGRQQIGEVVGVRSVADGLLYDVSLERVVVKAVEEGRVCLAHSDDVRTLLSVMVAQPPSALSARELLLRQHYTAFLTAALARLDDAAQDGSGGGAALFEVGQTVATRDGSFFALGVVSMVSRRADGLAYVVDVMGESKDLGESEIMPLHEVPQNGGDGLALGARARFLSEGHEEDDAFVGTICGVDSRDGACEYSLMFDDGDILEGIASVDLLPCDDG